MTPIPSGFVKLTLTMEDADSGRVERFEQLMDKSKCANPFLQERGYQLEQARKMLYAFFRIMLPDGK